MASLSWFDQLRAAVIDGRAENVRYRQNEIQNLHAALRNNSDAILSAITEDTCGSGQDISPEARCEYYLAMNAVKRLYESLDFNKSLKTEYQIANGTDFASRRVGRGLVILRPTKHTRFYSTICPIATAITAGNCTCLEMEDTMLNVDHILKELLPQALDNDTFYISSSRILDSTILKQSLLVDQLSTSPTGTLDEILSNPSGRTIAVVDRGVDIEAAARSVVTARFSFQGTSPYSPDLVIVNDFIKDKFIDACVGYASKFFSASTKGRRTQNNDNSETKRVIKEAQSQDHVSTFGSSNFAIVDIHERNSPVTQMKVSGCHLLVMECTSLVDSIMLQKSATPLLAAYIFADPSPAKFLAQHLNARATYVNHIPLHLLVGPAAPFMALDAPTIHKYSVNMFSSPRPQYISLPSSDIVLVDELFGESQGTDNKSIKWKKLQNIAVMALPKTGQPLGHALGFFEQGIVLGAGLFFVVFLPSLGYGSWVLGSSAWKMLMRLRMR